MDATRASQVVEELRRANQYQIEAIVLAQKLYEEVSVKFYSLTEYGEETTRLLARVCDRLDLLVLLESACLLPDLSPAESATVKPALQREILHRLRDMPGMPGAENAASL